MNIKRNQWKHWFGNPLVFIDFLCYSLILTVFASYLKNESIHSLIFFNTKNIFWKVNRFLFAHFRVGNFVYWTAIIIVVFHSVWNHLPAGMVLDLNPCQLFDHYLISVCQLCDNIRLSALAIHSPLHEPNGVDWYHRGDRIFHQRASGHSHECCTLFSKKKRIQSFRFG